VFGTIAPIAIGFLLAVLLWGSKRFALVLRTLYFLPVVLPTVVLATVWGWIYNPLFGPLNAWLVDLGLPSLQRGWLGDPHTALGAVLTAAVWGTFGLVVVIVFAALQNINTDLVDAAEIDGANWYRRAWHIMLPSIAPVITMITTITLIGGFSVFDVVFIMTGGGPGTSTEVLGTYTYRQAFNDNQIGYGAALSMVITAVSLVTAVVFVRLRERSSRYV
jgi:raffinose/stachyose/melibiose transport system permease protein